MQLTKFILAFKCLTKFFFLPQLFTHKEIIVFFFKLFKRYIDCFSYMCELITIVGSNFLGGRKKYCAVGR